MCVDWYRVVVDLFDQLNLSLWMLRNLTDDPRCKRCTLDTDETLIHLLRDCPTSRAIWKSIGSVTNYPSFWQGDLEQWMCQNLEANGLIYSDKWPTCFALSLWWIWRWRNCMMFGRPQDIPLHTGEFIRIQTDDTWLALNRPMKDAATPGKPQLKKEIYVRWMAPPEYWFTLNIDGAAKGTPGEARGGGVIRDTRGVFVCGFTANFGICSAYRAELLAAQAGLEFAMKKGIKKLVLQMDNQICVEALKNPVYQGGECYHILNYCRAIINSSSLLVHVSHCYREGNKVADCLANLGVIQAESIVYFDVAPSKIVSLLREDIIGVALPRLVA